MCRCKPAPIFAFRVAYASVGVVVGISVFFVFGTTFHHRVAACWGLASGVVAAIALLQFIYLYVTKELRHLPPNGYVLAAFGLLGGLAMGVGVGGFAGYLGLGIIDSMSDDEPPLVRSNYIVCVWSFMLFKWGITTYLYAIRSFKYLQQAVVDDKPMGRKSYRTL